MSELEKELDCACDDFCDLNPKKICDSCGKCLETDKDYASIKITAIEKNTES